MVLVSIHPFASWKIFLLAAALLGLSSVVCFGDSLFMARHYAPSRDQGRRTQLAIESQANLQSFSICQPALRSDTEYFSALRSITRVDMAVFEDRLEWNQVPAISIAPRSCEIPVCVPSSVGLALALAPPSGTGVGSF